MSAYPVLDFHYHALMVNYHYDARNYYDKLSLVVPYGNPKRITLLHKQKDHHRSQCAIHYLEMQRLIEEEKQTHGSIDRLVGVAVPEPSGLVTQSAFVTIPRKVYTMEDETKGSILELKGDTDFDWDSEEGQYLNLMLNVSGGLSMMALSEEEKALVKRVEEKYAKEKAKQAEQE